MPQQFLIAAGTNQLLGWGALFDRGADGRPSLGREAAHSVRRVLHAGDRTGREIGARAKYFVALRQNIVDVISVARAERDEVARRIARQAARVARCATIACPCDVRTCADRDRASTPPDGRTRTPC